MPFVKEKYTEHRIDLIQKLLNNEAEGGHPKYYDVRVDDLKVVSRTNDPTRFFSHEEFVSENTKNVTVCIYDNTSNRCMHYILLLQDEPPSNETLAGIENNLTEKLTHYRAQWDLDQLRKDKESLENDLKAAYEENDQLTQRIVELQEEKKASSGQMTSSIMSLASAYIQSNPGALKKLPFVGGLLGGGDDTPSLSGTEENGEPAIPAPVARRKLSPQEALTESVSHFFSKENSVMVLKIISRLNKRPSDVPLILSVLEDPQVQNFSADSQKQKPADEGKTEQPSDTNDSSNL